MTTSPTAPRTGRGLAEPSAGELAGISQRFEAAEAREIVAWAVETFGDELCIAASMADAVLIDLATRIRPGIDVVFVDTGYHFPETLETLERVEQRYPVRTRVARDPRPTDELWRRDPDACCAQRKVAPFEQALEGYRAWLSGLRRADSSERASAPIVTRDSRGLVSIRPLATWTDDQLSDYIARNDVVENPLLHAGYPSIGCAPCTARVDPGGDPRAGRWLGSTKTECGLNL